MGRILGKTDTALGNGSVIVPDDIGVGNPRCPDWVMCGGGTVRTTGAGGMGSKGVPSFVWKKCGNRSIFLAEGSLTTYAGQTVMQRHKNRKSARPVPDRPGRDGFTSLAAQGVAVVNPREVRAYLRKHTDLAGVVPSFCKRARKEFGPEAELSLELYRDPEIDDRPLTLYVRQGPYDPDILARIEQVSAVFEKRLVTLSGYLLLTTDFAKPQRANLSP